MTRATRSASITVVNALDKPTAVHWHGIELVMWRPLAKDGADLPTRFRGATPARAPISIGETADFEFLPSTGGEWRLVVRALVGKALSTQPIRVLSVSSSK